MKNNQFKNWITAFRLRTLPLSLASIITGCGLAYYYNKFDFTISVLAIVTTIFLQVLSNIANDLGDYQNGGDANRKGPERMVQSGKITPTQMKNAVIILVILSLISALGLIFYSFKTFNTSSFIFFLLGLAAIWAAIKYTMGKNPYGYNAMGDIFVFIFFGLVAVGGSFYLQAKELPLDVIILGYTMGVFSSGVLNLNNMRDIETDKESNKNTIVVKLGLDNAKKYHAFLIISGIISALIFSIIHLQNWVNLMYIPIFIIPLIQLKNVLNLQSYSEFDPYLKKLAIFALLFSIVFSISINL